jgi:hypothetical protein
MTNAVAKLAAAFLRRLLPVPVDQESHLGDLGPCDGRFASWDQPTGETILVRNDLCHKNGRAIYMALGRRDDHDRGRQRSRGRR